MKLSQLDLGSWSHPLQLPVTGQSIGTAVVEGSETVVYGRGATVEKQTVSFWIRAWQGIGGGAALSYASILYLTKQVEELSKNTLLLPCFIQWSATAEPGAYNAVDAHDGWYLIDDFHPEYGPANVSGVIHCTMTVTKVAPPPLPRTMAAAWIGGALSSNFSGATSHLLSLPLGATPLESFFNRTSGEGAIPSLLSPVASPEPFVPSATLANLFKGGVHVYDTINTSTNPVPGPGTFVNTNWVEVFYTDHDFSGDCVITNGLQLLLFQVGAVGFSAYLWNIALATPTWQLYGTVNYIENGFNGGTVRQYSLIRVSAEEAALALNASANGQAATLTIRLQRGRYEVRVDVRPLTQATSGAFTGGGLYIGLAAGVPKILYNSAKVADNVLSETAPAFTTDYGYGAAFSALTTFPLIVGFLYQNESGTSQPGILTGNTNNLIPGDSNSIAVGAQRTYGFFAVPFGVSGTYSPANLQSEAELGVLGTGWTSQAGAGANSNALEAKCASGTLAGNADTFGSPWVPAVANYDIWFRVKVTTNVGSALEMTLGLWNDTDSVFVGSTTFNRTAMTTSYAWYRAAVGVVPTATKNMRFRAVTALTLGTDWFIDEAIMVPTANLGALNAPRDIWQQFMYDRSVQMVAS